MPDTLTIWKFPLQLTDEQTIAIPRRYEILTCQIQNGMPALWAIVDPTEPLETAIIRIVATGKPLPDKGLIYIGTTGGSLAWHVFREPFQHA